MLRKTIIATGWVLLFWPCLLGAQEQAALKIAVLPCEVFSMQEGAELGREVSEKLSKRIAINPVIVVAGMKEVLSVVRQDDYADLNAQRLKEISRLLSANFVLFGSITKIRTEISIDVQMYSSLENGGDFKTFAEGVDLEIVLEKIASRVEQELLSKAALVPPSQRPRIQAAKLPAPAPKKQPFDLDTELAEVLGEPEKTPDKAQGPPSTAVDAEPVQAPEEPAEEDLMEEDLEAETDRAAADEEAAPEETALEGDVISEEEVSSEVAVAAVPETDARVKPETIVPQTSTETKPAPQEKKSKQDKKQTGREFFESDKPVNISSDSMEYDNKENKAFFNGNVVARQGNFVIFADKMRVVYSESGGLKQVKAMGQVKIIQGERIATGKQIVFYNDQQKIVATGNPRVWQGDNVVYGKKITIFLKEDRSVVEGGPESRASATIYPRKKKSKSDQ